MMMMMMMRGKSGGWVVVASRYFIPGLILEYEIVINLELMDSIGWEYEMRRATLTGA